MVTRYVKILLMVSICAWGLASGVVNLLAYAEGYGAVAFVLSMKGAAGAPAMCRAIENPVLIHAAFAFIWGCKLITAGLCGYSTVQLWRFRHQSGALFHRAAGPGLAGAGLSIFMLFFGFVVLSGAYFEFWRDTTGLGFDAHVYALVYAGFLGLSALLVAVPEERA